MGKICDLLDLILQKDNLNEATNKLRETREKVELMVCRWMNFCPS